MFALDEAKRFNSMQTTAQLVSTLEDTQASLATALARIEAYRIREQHLLDENLKLQEEIRRLTGFDGSENSPPVKDLPSKNQTEESANYLLHEEYPIVLHTKKGSAPGALSARPECLEIFETKAQVTPGQCIGITKLADKSNQQRGADSPKLNSKSWPWALFGKSKTAEDVSSQSKHSSGQSLKRSSWSGELKLTDPELRANPRDNDPNQTSFWRVLWKEGGGSTKIKQIVFEANSTAETFISRQIKNWSNAISQASSSEDLTQPSTSAQSFASPGSIIPAKHLIPDGPFSGLSVPSRLLNEEQVRCLTSSVPPRHRHKMWNLLYSTERHGISMQTMLRKAHSYSPTILVIKDSSDFIFGCYCSEPWKTARRFYGTGETFVFQLEPHRVYYPWKQESTVPNNFFMFTSLEGLGVGGTGHFAIWLDTELLYGRSGICDTFGSPCIASTEEFKVIKLELWSLS